MAKPAIVLVHGFWGNAGHWGRVILELSKLGYDNINAVDNPLTSLEDDAARTRKMIKQINGPVILAGHSYGGAVITEAGTESNVSALVYIAAFAPDTGESIGSLGAAFPPTPASRRRRRTATIISGSSRPPRSARISARICPRTNSS